MVRWCPACLVRVRVEIVPVVSGARQAASCSPRVISCHREIIAITTALPFPCLHTFDPTKSTLARSRVTLPAAHLLRTSGHIVISTGVPWLYLDLHRTVCVYVCVPPPPVVRHSSFSSFHHHHHKQQHHHISSPTRRRVSALLPPYRANTHWRRLADTSRSTPTSTKVNKAIMASAVRDITTTSLGRDNLTAVAARSVPVTATHPIPLPTPPNSMSPTLPPHGLKAQLQRAQMDQHVDSDLDLHGDHDTDHNGSAGSPPYESAGINAAMLAKFHLPEILLNHGPLAIRHIMGYLTSSIPGFAEIPPTKARRLVVGALEGRGSGGEGGGLDGDVQFEKVGWGIWQARRRGQPSGYMAARRASPHGDSQPASIPITRNGGWNLDRLRIAAAGSLDGESCAAFSFDDRSMHMMDHEVDRMSLDGSASASCSEAPDDDDDIAMDDDTEDATDDEDWAAVGAAALRATSYQAPSDRFLNANSVYATGGLRSFSSSVGMARSPQFRTFNFATTTPALTTPSDAQEREAVEALLRLGSV
ncbi:putative Sin3 binding domain-containing protein [Neurospora intermedia]|uniref:Sin3 binding domain-containing protein n=1 Tax=Neurospora intermedia TaxID=5142 RepID=A0ABR3DLH6_NEUIN